MWLCLNNGFLSVVQDFHHPNNLLVRARDFESIKNIFGENTEVTETPDNDYRFRASIPREIVGEVIATKLANIEYGNFKNSVQNHGLHDAYSAFWHTMYMYQENRYQKHKYPS